MKKKEYSYTKIQVRIGIYADKLDFDYITKVLEIKPSKLCLSKYTKINGISKDGWEYIKPYEDSLDVDEQVDKALRAFSMKEGILKEICERYDACVHIKVWIRIHNWKDYPYMSLSKSTICKMAELNVDNFDISYS